MRARLEELTASTLGGSDARYDLIWVQWCLQYLTDDDVVATLKTLAAALREPNGVLVCKENWPCTENWPNPPDPAALSACRRPKGQRGAST